MSALLAAVLGFVQGATEFLPISSSGHLVIAQHLFGLHEPMVFFDVMLHLGTLAAVVAVYWRELPAMVGLRGWGGLSTPRTAVMIVVATVPTGLIGVFGRDLFAQAFGTVSVACWALIVTGCALWSTRFPARRYDAATVTLRDALVIGLAQGVAITPGISRSGATIAAALWLGLDRELAARFSFLLAIPAILGAAVVEWQPPAALGPGGVSAVALGTAIAALTGFFALHWLLDIVKEGGFWKFAPYCWLLGVLGLLLIGRMRERDHVLNAALTPRPVAALVVETYGPVR